MLGSRVDHVHSFGPSRTVPVRSAVAHLSGPEDMATAAV